MYADAKKKMQKGLKQKKKLTNIKKIPAEKNLPRQAGKVTASF